MNENLKAKRLFIFLPLQFRLLTKRKYTLEKKRKSQQFMSIIERKTMNAINDYIHMRFYSVHAKINTLYWNLGVSDRLNKTHVHEYNKCFI